MHYHGTKKQSTQNWTVCSVLRNCTNWCLSAWLADWQISIEACIFSARHHFRTNLGSHYWWHFRNRFLVPKKRQHQKDVSFALNIIPWSPVLYQLQTKHSTPSLSLSMCQCTVNSLKPPTLKKCFCSSKTTASQKRESLTVDSVPRQSGK